MLPLLILLAYSGKELIDAIRRGDNKAFEELFNQLYDDLYSFLAGKGIDPESRKDLIQKAFISLWEKREKLEGSPRALLFRMVINRSANLIRDNKKFADMSLLEMSSSSESPMDSVERIELHNRIESAIESLPEKRRQVFELCYMAGLSYRETAQALGLSIKTIENQMSSALKSLRSSLKDA